MTSSDPAPASSGNGTTSHTAWWVVSCLIGLIALVVAVIGVVAGMTDSSAGAESGGSNGEDPETPAGETEFEIELGELYIRPATIEVPADTEITLHVTNAGTMAHDLKVDGTDGTEMLDPGAEETITIGPFPASTQAWCTVAGHKAAGMVMDIVVAGSEGGDHGTDGGDTSAEGDYATIDSAATPGADWVARDPVLPAAEAATVHEIELVASETVIEVAPGVTQEMWVFNGSAPGPILRGKLGDTFRVTLRNEGSIGHSIDFHASMVAWDDEMRTIASGEELVYEFEATKAGAYMYHCGTAPALHHIGNGMFGAIIIDPPDLPPVAEEFVITQSELYLGPEGQPGDLTKMLGEDWDAVVFNGYYNQYVHAPIHVEVNERYRVWVVDDGPSENSAFHIVGTIFDTVFKEGAYTLSPDESEGGSQALDLQPSQGGFVEFTFAEDGLYPFVTHKFANASKGALGFFAAGDADTSALGGH